MSFPVRTLGAAAGDQLAAALFGWAPRLPGLDDDPVDPCRVTSALAVGPDITYVGRKGR